MTCSNVLSMRRAMADAAAAGADAVELRADYLDPPVRAEQLRTLLADAPLETIFTVRLKAEGGRFEGDEADRLALLRLAAKLGADWVDVEQAVRPEDRPAERVILSRHDFTGCPGNLPELVAELDASAAAVSKIAFAAAGRRTPFAPWTCFATGESPPSCWPWAKPA